MRRSGSEVRMTQRNPLWSKAPWALIRYPGLALALCLGTLLLAVVAAAYPLFVSASGGNLVSAAVNQNSITRWGAGISFTYERLSFDRRPPIRAGNIFFPASPDLDSAPQHERIDELFARAFAGNEPVRGTVLERARTCRRNHASGGLGSGDLGAALHWVRSACKRGDPQRQRRTGRVAARHHR